jgi:hypothetical protein
MDREWFRIVVTIVISFLAGACLVFAGLLLRPDPAANALTDFLGLAKEFVRWVAGTSELFLAPVVLGLVSVLINWFRRKTSPPPKGLLIDLLIPHDRADDMVNNLLGAYERWVRNMVPE